MGRRRPRPARAGQGARRARARRRGRRRAPAGAAARDPDLLGRRLGPRGRRGGPARPARCRRSPPRPPTRLAPLLPPRGDGRQPARLHRDDLGRAGAARGDRADGRRRPGRRPAAAVLRRAAGLDAGVRASWDAVRDGLADGAPAPTARARRLDAARAAPGRLRGRRSSRAACPPSPGCGPRWPASRRCGRPLGDPDAAAGDRGGRAGARSRAAARGWARPRRRRCCATPASPCPTARWSRTRTTRSALAAALGGPVAVKASSAALQHKSEAGALVLGVARRRRGARRLPRASRAAARRPGAACSSRRWRRPASSSSSPRGATRSCPRSSSASAASGPSCSTTSRSSRCRPRRSGSRPALRSLRGAGLLTGAPRDGRRSTCGALARARRGRRRPPARRGPRAARAQPGDRRRRRARSPSTRSRAARPERPGSAAAARTTLRSGSPRA